MWLANKAKRHKVVVSESFKDGPEFIGEIACFILYDREGNKKNVPCIDVDGVTSTVWHYAYKIMFSNGVVLSHYSHENYISKDNCSNALLEQLQTIKDNMMNVTFMNLRSEEDATNE